LIEKHIGSCSSAHAVSAGFGFDGVVGPCGCVAVGTFPGRAGAASRRLRLSVSSAAFFCSSAAIAFRDLSAFVSASLAKNDRERDLLLARAASLSEA
jgi:hypothetical protein